MAFKTNNEPLKVFFPQSNKLPINSGLESSQSPMSLSEDAGSNEMPLRKKKTNLSQPRIKAKNPSSNNIADGPRKLKSLEMENKKLERTIRNQKLELSNLRESNQRMSLEKTNLVNEIKVMKKHLNQINTRLNKSLEGVDKKRIPGGNGAQNPTKKRDSSSKRISGNAKSVNDAEVERGRVSSMFEYDDRDEEEEEEISYTKDMGLNSTSKDEKLIIERASPMTSNEHVGTTFNDILNKMERITDRGSFVDPVTPLNTLGEKDSARKKRISDRLFTFKRSLNDEKEENQYNSATRPLLNDRTVKSLFEDLKQQESNK